MMRYGKFGAPAIVHNKTTAPSIALLPDPQWWTALDAETRAHNGRVLVYVHGYRNMYFYVLDDWMVWLVFWIPSIIVSFIFIKVVRRFHIPAIFGFTAGLAVLLVIMRLLFHARE